MGYRELDVSDNKIVGAVSTRPDNVETRHRVYPDGRRADGVGVHPRTGDGRHPNVGTTRTHFGVNFGTFDQFNRQQSFTQTATSTSATRSDTFRIETHGTRRPVTGDTETRTNSERFGR